MNARIAKLESLLGRIQERAAAPRPVRAVAAPTTDSEAAIETPRVEPPAAVQAPQLDEPELDAPVSAAPELDAPDLGVSAMSAPESVREEAITEELDELDEIDMDLDEVEIDDVDDIELDEELPESGTASASIEDAMEAAEHQPPLTPPPESGEGLTTPQIPSDEGPTMEQLGETISLEEGRAQSFELDEPSIEEAPASSHLEMQIPASVPPAADDLSVPAEAREELDRHRLGDSTPVEARVSTRPVLSTNVVDLVSSSKSFEPASFLELLDASLKLK